ncbi:MAG TPA: ABC transporter ATP-binding protein [Mycobacteriales bacterium]|nr:ABC transporter ATP-binding protein [Mycobacteriales bacterium]
MKTIGRILAFGKTLWPYYVVIGVLSIFTAALELAPPLLTRVATDEIVALVQHKPSRLAIVVWAVVAILIAGVLATVLSNISGYLGDVMASRLRKILSAGYFRHLLTLPQTYFDNELTGKIVNRLSRSIANISEFMKMVSNMLMSWILTTIFTIAIITYVSWQLGLLVFAVYPIFFFMTLKTSKRWMKYEKEKNYHADVASGRFSEAVSQVKVVKSFMREATELRFFNKHLTAYVDQTYPQARVWHIQDIYRRLVLEVAFFGMFFYIIYQTYHGHFSIGQMVMLLQYIISLRMPLTAMSFLVDQTQQAVAGSTDFFEAMALAPEESDAHRDKHLQVSEGKVEFRDVSFGYDEGRSVLKEISFTVDPRTTFAPVGESGGGKTTLTNLLMRLYTPQSGTVLIDGQDISRVSQKSVRENIGVVFQEAELFSGTIRENIAYGNPDASDEEIVEAARAANAHEFISHFGDGYATEIGERGIKLSGGQRQRIAIARAVLKDAPILILDEATNALDSRSEALVQDALERLMFGRTTIVIAHRLSTIASVDQIITLRNGAVDEAGKPSKLARTEGVYGQLLALQSSGEERQQAELKKYGIAVGDE